MSLIRFMLMLLLATAGSAAHAEWRRAESPQFVVYSEGSEQLLRQRILLLEDYDWLLRTLTGLKAPPSPNKLHVYLAASNSALRQIRPGIGSQVAGFYSASPHGIAAVAQIRGAGDRDFGQQVLLHEYAHHFMSQYFPTAYPGWYREGFAEYFMTAEFEEDRIEVGRYSDARAAWLADTGTWIPLERLLFEPDRVRGDDVARFYAQSWLLVHYMFRSPTRRPQLSAYLTALGRAEDARKAFETHFETTPRQLTAELRSYIRGKMTYTTLTRKSRSDPPPVTITPLGASDAIVHLDAALRIGAGEDDAGFMQRVRRAGEGQTSPFARRVLAKAEAMHGDGAAADRLLDPLLAASPQDAELLYLRGMKHLVAGRRDEASRAKHFAEARQWFGRAHKADANHFQTLYRYAESLATGGAPATENTSNVLLLAYRLAPQVDEIGLNAASMLISLGHHQDARVLLQPLLGDQHNEETAAAAKRLFERTQTASPAADAPAQAEPAPAGN